MVRNLETQLDHLLELNEAYSKQWSCVNWLAGGDRNTKFFHHKASARRQNNRISGVQSETIGWITNPREVKYIFLKYFHMLFTTSRPTSNSITTTLFGLEARVTRQMRDMLDAPYTPEEVQNALFGIAPWKAPGPDGFRASFFQSNWDLVGELTTSLCLQILNGSISIGDLNTTYLILILKVKHPRLVTNYRPISLCNVIAKVVAKAIANHLKCHLQELIDHEQSEFVLGRLITDNILVAFECWHTIRKEEKRSKMFDGNKN